MTTLLVASTGGHLKELHHLRTRLGAFDPPFRWVTFDTEQSRSLLAGEVVDFVPFVGGRDPAGVMRNGPLAARIVRDRAIEAVVSTGSAVALPYFAAGRLRGLRCHYIESAARVAGPSLTGKLMGLVPGVARQTQCRAWAGGRWSYGGSVFDAFTAEECPRPAAHLSRIVVSLGTYRGYDFSRLVRRLLSIVPTGTEVLWQTGDTEVAGLGVEGHRSIPEREFTEALRQADVVVAHAGVGTALAAFEVGKCPVLVPRRHALGEHVDDHQIQVAGELSARGLAISADADKLDEGHLFAAASRAVTMRDKVAEFAMGGA